MGRYGGYGPQALPAPRPLPPPSSPGRRPGRILTAQGSKGSAVSKMTVKEAGENLARTVRRVREERERLTLTEDGKPVAALVTAEDLAFLEDLEERIDLEEARKALAEGGESIPWEKVKAELGL